LFGGKFSELDTAVVPSDALERLRHEIGAIGYADHQYQVLETGLNAAENINQTLLRIAAEATSTASYHRDLTYEKINLLENLKNLPKLLDLPSDFPARVLRVVSEAEATYRQRSLDAEKQKQAERFQQAVMNFEASLQERSVSKCQAALRKLKLHASASDDVTMRESVGQFDNRLLELKEALAFEKQLLKPLQRAEKAAFMGEVKAARKLVAECEFVISQFKPAALEPFKERFDLLKAAILRESTDST